MHEFQQKGVLRISFCIGMVKKSFDNISCEKQKKYLLGFFFNYGNMITSKMFLVKGFLEAQERLFVRNIFCNNCILFVRFNTVCYI